MRKTVYSVLIDLDRLKDLTTGLGQVAVFFGQALSKINDTNFKFTFLVPEKYNGFFGNAVGYENVSLKRRYFSSLGKKYDLWYTIHQDSSYFPAKGTPYILTINDLNFLGEKTPRKAKQRLNKLQKKVDKAVAITVISKNTEKVVRENLIIPAHVPIHVIYCGVEVKTFAEVKKPAFVPAGDLLFSIGVVKPNKNIKVLIPFIEKLPGKYKLIIAGNKSSKYAEEIAEEIKTRGLQNRILLTGKISDEDKFWMYTNCKAVLFPSKFEGMGFPPVEAMKFGKPVFAFTFSSIPEVSEDKAYYWDNFEPEHMSKIFLEKIDEFYKDKARPEIVKKHSSKYDWDTNAAAYVKLFKEVLGI